MRLRTIPSSDVDYRIALGLGNALRSSDVDITYRIAFGAGSAFRYRKNKYRNKVPQFSTHLRQARRRSTLCSGCDPLHRSSP